MDKIFEIAVLMASFNRCDKTLACIRNVLDQKLPSKYKTKIYLFDDASSDGTASKVSTLYPDVVLLKGDGQSYWTGSMRKLFVYARQCDYDYYLWLNDDVELYDTAMERLLQVSESEVGAVVGSCRAHSVNQITYGGLEQKRWGNRFSLKRVAPSEDTIKYAQTFNGNIVLLSKYVVDKVGVLSHRFTHGMGDIDYGFRVIDAGLKILVIPGFAGLCDANYLPRHLDKNLTVRERLKALSEPKGLPMVEWLYLTKTHMPVTWWVPFFLIYVRTLFPK
jgi:GT2 family glycosyltransferase